MKKILLSCVTCLLALGLVTACDNEDEVVENDGTTQDTGTGGGTGGDTGTGGGTQGGGAEEVTTLSNYTLSFTLTGEEIPDYATLYITGDFNEWGFEALEVGEGVYTYTFDTITADWHNFKLVMWYSDEEVSWEGGNYVEVVNEPWIDENGETQYGNAYFEVTASQGDGYTLELTYEVSATLEEKVVTVTSIALDPTTLSFAYEDIAAETKKTITASVIGSDGSVMEEEEVTWASDTETVATVEEGVVTPVATGSTVITATSDTDETVSATCSVYVGAESEVLVEKVEIDPNELTLTMDEPDEGHSATVTATVSGADGATPTNPEVSWSQTGDVIEIGTPTQTELVSEVTVTALAAGSGTLTATAGGVTASIPVTVEPIGGDGKVTLNIFFVDDSDTPNTYYSLPTYPEADAAYQEVVAYVEYVDVDGTTWVDPSEASGYLKLNAIGTSAGDGYAVEMGELREGTIGVKIFFEWASEVGTPSDGKITDWDHFYPSDGTLSVAISAELAAEGGTVSLLVPVDPSTILYPPSESDLISVTVGIKNTRTATNTHTFKIKGGKGSEGWAENTLQTYSGDNSDQIDLAYTYTEVNKTSQKLEFEIYDGSESWGNGVGAYFIDNENDNAKKAGSIEWSTGNYYLYCTSSDSGGGPTWGLDLPALNTADSTKLNKVTELIVILSFDFDSYSTTDNLVVSSTEGFSFIAVK